MPVTSLEPFVLFGSVEGRGRPALHVGEVCAVFPHVVRSHMWGPLVIPRVAPR